MIWQAGTEIEIARCYPVMRELRPHLADEADFVARVRRQMTHGYRLTSLKVEDEVCAVAGWRILENLVYGKFLYVDDLVTREEDRGEGHGGLLLDWLIAEARREECAQLHLDSGVQRFAAHRFYLKHRMNITSHHFGMEL